MAVLLVVLFHAGVPLSGGFVGVDVFFVISGFLITGLLLREVETSMVDGLVRTWTEVLSWGTKLAVIVDHPTPQAFGPTPECLLANPRDHSKCAFDRGAGAQSSASGVQRAASARVSGARLVDLTDFICPQERCAPVIGDVLVYRDERHLTNTYARSLAPMLTAKLAVAAADDADE